jgi:hypothetical protein
MCYDYKKQDGKEKNVKAAKITIRIIIMFLAAVWGLLLGIAGPLFIMGSDMQIASHHALRVWLVMAVAGLIAPCFLVMLDKSRTAAIFAVGGTALMLYIHTVFAEHTYTFTYMPQLFMTILTILYVFILNPHYVTEPNQRRRDRLNAPAPSILDKRKEG